jgi:hypothetical protein
MNRNVAVNQLAIVAAGARPCAVGHAWHVPSLGFAGMKQDETATPRPLGRLPD